VAVVDGMIYAMGGFDGSYLSVVERFTTATAIEDPSVTLDGTTISYNGMLGSGDTKIDTVSVAPGSYSGDVSAANSKEWTSR
jgi:Kelch motif.